MYLMTSFKEVMSIIFKPTYITYAIIGGILVIVGVMMIINFDWTFTQFHHILFPRMSDFNDAFFTRTSNYKVDNDNPYINNLLLVTVLSIEVFMDAAWIIVAYVVIILITLFVISFIFRKKKLA